MRAPRGRPPHLGDVDPADGAVRDPATGGPGACCGPAARRSWRCPPSRCPRWACPGPGPGAGGRCRWPPPRLQPASRAASSPRLSFPASDATCGASSAERLPLAVPVPAGHARRRAPPPFPPAPFRCWSPTTRTRKPSSAALRRHRAETLGRPAPAGIGGARVEHQQRLAVPAREPLQAAGSLARTPAADRSLASSSTGRGAGESRHFERPQRFVLVVHVGHGALQRGGVRCSGAHGVPRAKAQQEGIGDSGRRRAAGRRGRTAGRASRRRIRPVSPRSSGSGPDTLRRTAG